MTCLTYSLRPMPSGSTASVSHPVGFVQWSPDPSWMPRSLWFSTSCLTSDEESIPYLLTHLQTALSSTMATPLILIACIGFQCAVCSGSWTTTFWFPVSCLTWNNTQELQMQYHLILLRLKHKYFLVLATHTTHNFLFSWYSSSTLSLLMMKENFTVCLAFTHTFLLLKGWISRQPQITTIPLA